MGIKILGISCICNYAAGAKGCKCLSAQGVYGISSQMKEPLKDLIMTLLE